MDGYEQEPHVTVKYGIETNDVDQMRELIEGFGSISVKRVKQNKGYYQFIRKWGMTSSTLSKYYLRRGDRFDGPLEQRPIPVTVQLKNLY
jgi:hypothetical protein